MGLLEKKSRILDTIVTDQGRRQMFTGQFRIRFVAFSDGATFYRADEVSGSADAQSRVFLEAASLPQDQVTFEADDSGKLAPFRSANGLGVLGGKVLTGSGDSFLTFVTGSEFASAASNLLSSSLDAFCKLNIIGSSDFFLDEPDFRLSRDTVNFEISKESPLPSSGICNANVNDIESFFQDKRLSHIPNFKFMPPINKKTFLQPEGSSLGTYVPLSQKEILTFEELEAQLKGKPVQTIEFLDTSRANNVMAQFFEVMPNEVKKLDIIDFGSFPSKDPSVPDRRVFFAGKVFTDTRGSNTFVNLFTLVYS